MKVLMETQSQFSFGYSHNQPPSHNLSHNVSYQSTYNQLPPPIHDDEQSWLGLSRQDCIKRCEQQNLSVISFAHWLSVKDADNTQNSQATNIAKRLLLTFRQQQCVAVMLMG